MAIDDDVVRELTWSGRRRRELYMARWRMITAVALATAALVTGVPWVWRLYHPTMNGSNTAELALDVWAQRREMALDWRACDDRDEVAGWHRCRVQVGGAPAVELWCAGDGIPPKHRTCSFQPPEVAPAPTSATLEHTMADTTINPHNPKPIDPITTPNKAGPAGMPLGPDPDAPPEAGGGQVHSGQSRPDQVGADASRTPAAPTKTDELGRPVTAEQPNQDSRSRR